MGVLIKICKHACMQLSGQHTYSLSVDEEKEFEHELLMWHQVVPIVELTHA